MLSCGKGEVTWLPRLLEDATLGRFEWDEEQRYWHGSLALPSGRVTQFNISPTSDGHAEHPDAPEVFAAAYRIAAWLRQSEREAYSAVSRAMLPLYNTTWSEESRITEEEFANRIELLEVWVPSNGEYVNLWFTDG